MKVHELIAQLQAKPRNATVYVLTTEADADFPVLQPVERIDPAESPEYGSAVIIEMGV